MLFSGSTKVALRSPLRSCPTAKLWASVERSAAPWRINLENRLTILSDEFVSPTSSASAVPLSEIANN